MPSLKSMARRQASVNRLSESGRYLANQFSDLMHLSLCHLGQKCPYCNAAEPVVQSVVAGLVCPCCGDNEQTEVITANGRLDPIRSVTVVLACQACAKTWHMFLDLSMWVAAIGVAGDGDES